jgi:FixJ family two-component response regulator
VLTQTEPIVYIVDDDKSVRQALKRLLRAEGIDVQVFESARHFLASNFTDQNACLVTDVKMCGLSGLELQQKLIAMGSMLPVILITGLDTEETRARARESGIAGYLRKPVDDQALLDAIHWALSRHPSQG